METLTLSKMPAQYSDLLPEPEAPSVRPTSAWRPDRALTPIERDLVYHDFQPLVRRMIWQFGDTPEERQDLAGEIYWRFCALLDEYDPQRGIALYAYLIRKLYTSTYAYARTQWRQKHRRARREVSLEQQQEAGLELQTPWSDPVDVWIQNEQKTVTLKLLGEAIGHLTERQRTVLIWRYYEGLSFDDIATRLGNKPATARSLLRHALVSLRAHFQEIR